MVRKRRITSPSQLLARRLSEEEIALKRRLIAAREAADMNQTDVADKLGVNRSAISRFERADSNPTLAMVRHYAHAIGAMVTYSVEPAGADTLKAIPTPERPTAVFSTRLEAVLHALGEASGHELIIKNTTMNSWVGGKFSAPVETQASASTALHLVPAS